MPNWPIINCFGVTVARVGNEHRTVALSIQSTPKITLIKAAWFGMRAVRVGGADDSRTLRRDSSLGQPTIKCL